MIDDTYPASGTAEPVHPVWGEPIEGEVLEASGPDPAKVVALRAAAELVGLATELVPRETLQDLGDIALGIAREFETYLNGKE